MVKTTGWLLDVFQDQKSSGMVLWLLTEDGKRLRLQHPFSVSFFVAGNAKTLRQVWKFLRTHPSHPRLSRQRKRDLFQAEMTDVLAVEVDCRSQPGLFREVLACFPQLTYYDADIKFPIRYAARYGTFPLCQCTVTHNQKGDLEEIKVLDSRWNLDPQYPPLRIMELTPDCNPLHAEPRFLLVKAGGNSYRFSLAKKRPLLISLQALLKRFDPDLLLTTWGDTWLLPWLFKTSQAYELPLVFNREDGYKILTRPERSYFSYGQIIYSGQQIHLYGRWHVDRKNAMFWQEFGLDGIYEMARVTAQPIQQAARTSPGTGISTMQILVALQNDILVPWHKQQAEHPKSAVELVQSDLGGLIYQPLVGLHRDVGAIDFISMYPAIMVRCNISPETGKPPLLEDSLEPPGLIPQTLDPLLKKRIALKLRLAKLPRRDPRRKLDLARSTAHKWLLVTCFGYLGYKNARFGRIEAHEAVTAAGREALLRAKETAEDAGFRILHMYVDGLWVQQPGKNRPEQFDSLLSEIASRTGLSIALDGIYRWVAFLPSRANQRVPVPNRYFGVFQDGTLKVRGLEARRRDTSPWVARLQMDLLEYLAQAETVEQLPNFLPGAIALLKNHLADLNNNRVPAENLLMAFRLSREPEAYRVKTAGARAAAQLAAIGKDVRPGQRVPLLYLNGGKVRAWDLPGQVNPECIDRKRYYELAVRAASAVFQPFGLPEKELRNWLQGGIQLCFDFVSPAYNKHILLPPYQEKITHAVFQVNAMTINTP